MTVETIAIISVFPLFLMGNLLFIYLFIRRAVKRSVIPFLEYKGYSFLNYKWVGFFDCGDFKNERMDFAFLKTGPNTVSIYSYIYYRDADNNSNSVTIKIDVVSLSIERVSYSSEV